MIRYTPAEQEILRAEYNRLKAAQPAAKFDSLVNQAVKILPADRQKDFTGKAPSQMPWLSGYQPGKKAVVGTTRRVVRRAVDAKSTSGDRGASALPETPAATPTLDEAIAVLCDVLVARVQAALDAKLEAILAQRIATSAIKLAPKPARGVDLDKLNTLDDATIKLEIVKAQASGDRLRLFKLVALRRKREEAANTIEFRSADQ